MLDAFGHSHVSEYYKAYCPMAFELPDGKQRGAAWLQASRAISNPYRVDMPRCGEIKRPFRPAPFVLEKSP